MQNFVYTRHQAHFQKLIFYRIQYEMRTTRVGKSYRSVVTYSGELFALSLKSFAQKFKMY